MKKRIPRFVLWTLAGLLLLLLVANLGINFWLKKKLPGYIKGNTEYIVSYKTLEVDLLTGNIHSTGLSVNSQHPGDKNTIGLQGTIDTLSVSRLGIYDYLVHKSVSSTQLNMIRPLLNVTLAKPVDDRTGKKRNPVTFRNINIKDGDIRIYQHTGRKFFSVRQLDLEVNNLKMTEESVEQKLPFVFDNYKIRGNHFFFRPDPIYAITAREIRTEEQNMKVKDFALIPLLNYSQLQQYYPKKRNLMKLEVPDMRFKNLSLKRNQLTLHGVEMNQPVLTMTTSQGNNKNKKKSFRYDVLLDNVQLNNARIQILNPSGNQIFAAQKLNMDIDKLKMNDETARGNIPFNYDSFRIRGKRLHYFTGREKIQVADIFLNPDKADLRSINITSAAPSSSQISLQVPRLRLNVDHWEFVNDKLKMEVRDILVTNPKGKWLTAAPQKKANPDFSFLQLPMRIRNVELQDADLTVGNKEKPIVVQGANAELHHVEMNNQTVKDSWPFRTRNYQFSAKSFLYTIPFYTLSATNIKADKNKAELRNFSMKPTVSRAQFIRQIPTERDLYDLKAQQVQASGTWDLVSGKKFIELDRLLLNGVDANIFRSKIPADDLKEKPLYSALLRSIRFPVFVKTLKLQNSRLVYEEDTKKSDGPGKLIFSNFELLGHNINSRIAGRPTQIPLDVRCRFMDVSPMQVRWTLDTASPQDAFSIAGNITGLPAQQINTFIEPYLKIRATGRINDLSFDFKGNRVGLGGVLRMKHENLKVEVLKKDGDKNEVLSAVANIFVRSDSEKFPASVPVKEVERDKTKSFFNLFWKGIEQGLKKTLLGSGPAKVTDNLTKKDTTSAVVPSKLTDGAEARAAQLEQPAEKDSTKKKKKNWFQRLFQKKSGK